MEHNDKRKLVSFATAFYIIIYYMAIMLFKTENQSSRIIEALFGIFPLLVVLIAMFKINFKEDKKSIFLSSLLIVVISNFIAKCFDVYYKVILKADLGNYVLQDIISVIGAFIFFIALGYKFYKKRDKGCTVVLTIDILTIMCVAVAATWIYNILPQLSQSEEINLFETVLHIVYPILHLVILSAAIILYKSMDSGDPEKKSISVIILAFLVMYITNMVYVYFLTIDSYTSVKMINPLWTLYDVLIMISAIEYSESKGVEWNRIETLNIHRTEFRVLLSGISIVLLFILVTFTSDKVVWICFGFSIVLINVRQIVTNAQKKNLILKLEEFSKELEEKVEERTKEIYEIESSDGLTGLVNRRRVESIATDMMEKSKIDNTQISVMLIDLDRFKIINDNYGHSFGDLLIKEFAYIIKKLINENSVVSRQGGDEFAIVTMGLKDDKYPRELAESILRKLISPIILNDQKIYMTCSIGISMYPADGKTYEDIIRCADLAMYNSKSIGRNTYSFYEEDMIKLNSKRMTLERELHKAVEKNEFVLHYQPQVDVEKNEIIGFEALVRWNHPTQGMISPFHFIPIAEETGMIGTIGAWVMETACIKMKELHEKGFDKIKIGVNISAYQFQQENFVDMVRSVLLRTRLSPKYLDLEITENIPMENEIDVITKLKKLKKLGVKVSMDDFGTGYSSLSYLRRLPIDTLKIPREFIIEIKPYDDKKNIIEAIIAIAQKLELSIIAEGVENETQLKFLKNKNCNLIQGYLFSKPLPESEVEEYLNKNYNCLSNLF